MITRTAFVAAAGVGLFFTLACGGSSNIDTSFLVPSVTGGGTLACPSGASEVSDFADGARVVLLAIHSDDAYAGSEADTQMPISGRVDGDLHNNDACWFGGGFVGDDGTEFYFYKAAFSLDTTAPTPTTAPAEVEPTIDGTLPLEAKSDGDGTPSPEAEPNSDDDKR
ncbi:MAG: hypothetical protein ACJAZO_002617 [Myxococcota bacterium]|jgi:hypothetical protein